MYFTAYHKGKAYCTKLNDGKDTPLAHVGGAVTAGVLTTTTTNPLWVVKTRMQLDEASIGTCQSVCRGRVCWVLLPVLS